MFAHSPWARLLIGLLLIATAGCGDKDDAKPTCDPPCSTDNECFRAECLEGVYCIEDPTTGDVCDNGNGMCMNGFCESRCADVDCDDENDCTEDACDPSDGTCSNTALADGAECAASFGGTCSGGECVAPSLDGCGPLLQFFADGDFADDTWTYEEAAGDGMRTIDSVTTETTGGSGDDGAYRRVEVTVTSTSEQSAGITVAHFPREGARYDPEDPEVGDICGFRVFLDGTDQFDQPQRSSFFLAFLLQNNTYYRGLPSLEVNTDTWEAGTWITEDFAKFVGPGPDVPVLSAPIQFGFLTASSRPTTAPGPGTTVAGADNFRVEIFAPTP